MPIKSIAIARAAASRQMAAQENQVAGAHKGQVGRSRNADFGQVDVQGFEFFVDGVHGVSFRGE